MPRECEGSGHPRYLRRWKKYGYVFKSGDFFFKLNNLALQFFKHIDRTSIMNGLKRLPRGHFILIQKSKNNILTTDNKTVMPSVHTVNLTANRGNMVYGIDVVEIIV